MTPTTEQTQLEGNAVADYLKHYRLSQQDFVALIFKRKEVTLDEAKRMVELYMERYPQVKKLLAETV